MMGCVVVDHLLRKRLRRLHDKGARLHKELIDSYEGLIAAKDNVIRKQDYIIAEQRKALAFFAERDREFHESTDPSPPTKDTLQ